jgi:hypothetical protein
MTLSRRQFLGVTTATATFPGGSISGNERNFSTIDLNVFSFDLLFAGIVILLQTILFLILLRPCLSVP